MRSKMDNPENEEMKQLCMQLDDVLDSFFQTLNKLLATRQDLDKAVKDGFYLMARARYSMGVKSVTSTQYNNDDLQKAFSQVNVLPSSDGDITFQAELASSKVRIPAASLLRNSKEISLSDDGQSENVELDEIGRSASDTSIQRPVTIQAGLRRRILPKGSASVGDASSLDTSSSDTDNIPPVEDLISGVAHLTCDAESAKEDTTSALSFRSEDDGEENGAGYGKDPLLWFGVLVPQPLRQSQAAFKNAIKLSCQIATLQNQLDQEKRNYEKMLARKQELQRHLCELLASGTQQSVDEHENSPDITPEECQAAE